MDSLQQATRVEITDSWPLVASLRRLLRSRSFDPPATTAAGPYLKLGSTVAPWAGEMLAVGGERSDGNTPEQTTSGLVACSVQNSVGGDLTLTEPLETLSRSLSASHRIEGEVGRGGMAVVYRATDLRQNRKVALKVLRPELAGMVAIGRFVQEIRISTDLNHPGIVPVLDSGEVDGLPWYTMPFIGGSTLRERLAKEKQLPIPEVVRIATEVAEALSFAHDRGFVHRDIKPDNILFEDGRAVVADFGIARAVEESTPTDRLTASGVMVGTPPYMAPEQGDAKAAVDRRADIYSLGCVVYELLAGSPPFTGPTAAAVRSRHQLDPVPPLRSVRGTVSPALEHVVMKALAKVPADRYSTVEDFAAALRNPPKVKLSRQSARLVATQSAAAAALVLAGGFAARQTFWRPDAALDANKVLILPLVERGLPASDSGTGYDIALVLGAALEHTEPLRWLDGRHYLDERVRSDANLVTARMSRATARSRGAAFYLDGVVRREGDSTAVTLRLHDVRGDSVLAQHTEAGDSKSIPTYRLALASVSQLLPRMLAAERRIDFTPLTERSPAAIALLLQGERQYRSARFEPALRLFERAVAEDSALAFAAVKGAQAANWLQYLPQTRRLLNVALAGATQLPQRYRDFAIGLDAYLGGRADSALTYLERAHAAGPEWDEAAMAIGDVYYHLLPDRGSHDSLARAFFEKAAASGQFSPPLLHLTEIAARGGDVGRGRELLGQLRAGQPDTTLLRQVTLMVDCVDQSAERFDWTVASAGNLLAMLFAAKGLVAAAAQPECAEAGFRALLAHPASTPGQRWSALIGLQGILTARGRIADLTSLLDSAATSTPQSLWLYLLAAESGLAVHKQATQFESIARQRYGDDYQGAAPHWLWMLSLHFARLGDVTRVESLLGDLESQLAKTGTRATRLLRDAVVADLAFAKRDTAVALRTLGRLVPTSPIDSLSWSLWEPVAVERLKLARLLIHRGAFADAHRVASAFDHAQPIAFVSFVPASLEIRLVAARALGDATGAATYRRRLERLGRRDLLAGL